MIIGEPYIRKKKDKLVIEIKADAKTIFLLTLPSTKDLIELLTNEPSEIYIENKIKKSQKASENIKRLDNQENGDANGS